MMRFNLFVLVCVSLLAGQSVAQLPPQQQTAQQAPTPPPAFRLNAIEQAYLDQVLTKWEQSSNQVQTFSCPFRRYVYNAFSPAAGIPASIEEGEISYQKPDKGSFKISQISRWQAQPVEPGYQGPPKGQHEVDPTAIGQHWVCDGKAIYEYKPNEKKLIEQPIPPHLQGKSIVNTPLPFVFGAEAEQLKRRFFMKAWQARQADGSPNPNVLQLSAVPKTIADAAEYQMVEIQLDQRTLTPLGMNIVRPDGSRNAYVFYKDKAQVNNTLDQVWNALFAKPRTPIGWTKVIDAPPDRSPPLRRKKGSPGRPCARNATPGRSLQEFAIHPRHLASHGVV